ncbi:MMPL family transporter [Conexibacter woesei]|uniref:MMPL domain protein n=1 Tax=Conexibacter woesei (strain DSM 14684 / CCUG 47730 / CIP 108061 / JCM 11494 / NBRC 100937 / ID131577) TaxID=469383 RepID=D3F7F5_CONWI|nr:MMPL family transporter [Conexibacter woesei]ADB50817.1 MMPL domain protein [Conexibacter woesei DSM 14684]
MSIAPPPQTGGSGLLGRIADAAFVHRRRTLLGWLAILVLAIAAMTAFGGSFTADYNTPGSDSEAAAQRLDERFAGRSGDQVDVVWKAEDASAPAVLTRIDRLLDEAERIPGVVPGASARDAQVSPDGRTAVVRLPLNRSSAAMEATDGEHLAELAEQTSGDGVEVAMGGAVPGLKTEPAMTAELVGVAVAALVLLLTFGTVVAAGLPLLVALFGVTVAVLFGGVLAAVLDTPGWSLQVSLMIGIGVGIDYALLILTRYRAALHDGKDPRAANVEAMSTAGHSVLTAGATVVVSLLGLFLMRLPYLYGVALASSLAVLIVMAASITLLPAILGLIGRRIDRWQVLSFGRPAADPERAPAGRWARLVTRRPLLATAVSLILLAVLTSPLTGIRFGFPDAGNDPADSTTRQAYALIANGFGPGANGPLIAVAGVPRQSDRAAVDRLAAEIGRDRDVVAVAPPQFNDAGDTALLLITPAGSPESATTKELVDRLRDGALADAGVEVDLGGQTAASVDQSDVTAARLPLFIGAVVLLSFALLVAAFRAPLIALKASVMTVLSIAAAYGVVALVAEGGWAGQLVGIDTDLPVPPFIPVMMFAVLFGLSMDYEVFLVSRIKEERERLGDARAAVTAGVAKTARVIVAAAAIMVSVFGAFALSPDVMLKLIGIGLAAAILIDAIIVRMILVPALMRLLGERIWWSPRRLAAPRAVEPVYRAE